jgi:pilus assembly protein Flp/PilA
VDVKLLGAAKPVQNGFGRADVGATAIEYALIAALVSVFIISAVSLTGDGLTGVYTTIIAAIDGVFGG